MLYKYLEMKPGDKDYLTFIKKKVADDFRGFEQFLMKPEINTSEKNVELLAWLIDFPSRPYSKYIEAGFDEPVLTEDEQDVKIDIGEGETIEPEATKPDPTDRGQISQRIKPDNKIDQRWLIGIAVLFIGVLIWWLSPGSDQCMYWNNDHYVATSCNVPRLDTPLVALDRSKLRGFLRIKRLDTLTQYSVGKLWYARVADSIEVYSAGGTHPLYPDKKLKKVTDYVVNVCHNRRN
jgi:hypothetical protein